MFEVATDVLIWLMLAAFVAGMVDSIAGGGGLITVCAFSGIAGSRSAGLPCPAEKDVIE